MSRGDVQENHHAGENVTADIVENQVYIAVIIFPEMKYFSNYFEQMLCSAYKRSDGTKFGSYSLKYWSC